MKENFFLILKIYHAREIPLKKTQNPP